jgi:hypothetical protein
MIPVKMTLANNLAKINEISEAEQTYKELL